MKNFPVNATFGDKVWITGKPKSDQNMMIIAVGELAIFFSIVGLSEPAGSHYCS
jgi:hypothetical protein